MRIGICINTAWNIYNFRRGIVKALLDDGHEVVAVAPRDEYVHRLQELGCTYAELPMKVSGINPLSDLLVFLRLCRIISSCKLDILLTYTIKPNIYGSLACRLIKIPVVCNVSGLGTVFIKRTVISRVAILLYRISVGKADHVFFQNDEDQELFTSKVRITGNTSLLNGSGVDLTQFQPRRIVNSDPIFLMIGRPMVEKGIYEYVEAARIVLQRYPNCQFHLLGRWDKNDKRSASVNEMSGWEDEGILQYLGTSDNMVEMISKADVIVLPSYREGTPRTLLEGGAMGKVLIATDVPGCHHVVKDGVNGFLAEAKNAESLAAAIFRYFALSQDEIESMQIRSRSVIEEKFDERLIIGAYKEVITAMHTRF